MEVAIKKLKAKYADIVRKRDRVAFIHVPKCGGTSIVRALRNKVAPLPYVGMGMTKNINLEASKTAAEVCHISIMDVRKTVLAYYLCGDMNIFVAGHVHTTPDLVEKFDNWKFVTILRKPVDRFVSEYTYNRYKVREWAKTDLDIDAYLESETAVSSAITYASYFSGMSRDSILENPQAAISASVENLMNFDVVGVIEEIGEWKRDIGNMLQSSIEIPHNNKNPNKAASKEILSSDVCVSRIRGLSTIDQEIYDRVLEFKTG